MVRTVSMGLRVLAPCVLLSVGAALAEDWRPNAAESSSLPESQDVRVGGSFESTTGITPAQELESPTAAQRLTLPEAGYAAVTDSLDSYAIGTIFPQPSPPPPAAQQPVILRHVGISTYADADSLGNRTVDTDVTFAPFSGLYESGMRFRLTGDASWYRFITSENPRTLGSGRYLEGDFLIGYGLWATGFNITGLVGPAFAQTDNLGTITDRWGLKASIEMSARPTDSTIAAGSVSYSTVANNLQVQAKAGIKVLEGLYVGPEATFKWHQLLPVQVNFFTGPVATTTSVSQQTNIAYLHLGAFSALSVGPVAIGLSGGWAHDQQLGSGYYGSASLYVPF